MSGVTPTLIDYQGIQLSTPDNDRQVTISMSEPLKGFVLDYDQNTSAKKFSITEAGINWTDGVSDHTTALEKVALLQTALAAVELPPNATTLKINDTILLDATTTETATLDNNSIAFVDDDGASNITQTSYQKNALGFSSQVSFGYNNSLSINLATGGTPCGISHLDNFPSPSDFTISTDQNIFITADNIDVGVNRLIYPSLASSNYIDYTSTGGQMLLNQSTTGGTANPMLNLQQNNTSAGSCGINLYKNISSSGSAISEIASFAKTNEVGNPIKEYTNITSVIRNNTTGNVDGSIGFRARVNDVLQEFMRINGAESQIEAFRQLDMNNNDITKIATLNGDILTNPNSNRIIMNTGSVNQWFYLDSNNFYIQQDNVVKNSKQEFYNNNLIQEHYIKQTYLNKTTSNTITTILENDATHHRIKLEETASGANTEITKDEIAIDSGSGDVMKITPTAILYNNVSIRPLRFYSSGSFSASGSPSNVIFDLGNITGMTNSQRWSIQVSLTFDAITSGYNPSSAVSYQVQDSVLNTNCDIDAPLGWTNSFYQTPLDIDPNNMFPSTKTYLSFNDAFVVGGSGMNPYKVMITGGTFDSSAWSGNYTASVVLTYIDY